VKFVCEVCKFDIIGNYNIHTTSTDHKNAIQWIVSNVDQPISSFFSRMPVESKSSPFYNNNNNSASNLIIGKLQFVIYYYIVLYCCIILLVNLLITYIQSIY